MPKIDVYNVEGKKVSTCDLKEEVFGIEPNETVVHSVLVNYLANQRQGTQSTKTRAEVRGGGRKPWRQKGTGRARQGSIRAPQWIKGGIALGPKPRCYKYRVNKKEKRLAIRSLLTSFIDVIIRSLKFSFSPLSFLKASTTSKAPFDRKREPCAIKSRLNVCEFALWSMAFRLIFLFSGIYGYMTV
jgi:ribosomal protein L4